MELGHLKPQDESRETLSNLRWATTQRIVRSGRKVTLSHLDAMKVPLTVRMPLSKKTEQAPI